MKAKILVCIAAAAAVTAFGASAKKGSSLKKAISLKSSQTATLVEEYDSEEKEFLGSGVAYYTMTLKRGVAYTVWITGGNAADIDLDVGTHDTYYDDREDEPSAGFDIDEPSAPQQEEPGGFDIEEPESEPTGTDVDEGAVIDDTEEPVRQPEPTKQPEPTPATPTPTTPATEDDGGFDLEGDDDGGFDIDDGGFDLEDDTNGFNLEDDDDSGSSVEDDGGAVIEDDAPAADPKKPVDDSNDIDDEYFDLDGF